jgi:hypothetical protein
MESRTPRVLYWLRERLRDVLMWPLNLIRDLPTRALRLLHTLRRALVGIVMLIPHAGRAIRRGKLQPWSRRVSGQVADWLHQFVIQLFDLIGGPEIAQFVMHLITNTTPLSGEELALIKSILGPGAMRYGDVRVAEGGLLDFVFKLNGNLAFSTWHTVHFPRQKYSKRLGHTRANLAIVVHELTHVYQYEQVGSRYLGEAIYWLVKTKRDCYDYGSARGLQEAEAAGKRYRDHNREQQAMIVQDYFTRWRNGQEIAAYEPFMKQLRKGEL